MSELLRPWKRPPKSNRYLSDSMIRDARLTPFQVAIIEERLLQQETKSCLHEIDYLDKKIQSLKTPEGIEEERRKLELERDQAVYGLKDLEAPDGINRACAAYASLMERYEMQNIEREKILETLKNQHRTNQELSSEPTADETVRRWKRPQNANRYVNDYLIAEAKLTQEQTSIIEIYLKSQEIIRIREYSNHLSRKLEALSTPEGIEEERTRLQNRCDRISERIANLETEKGIRRIAATYEKTIESLEEKCIRLESAMQNV